MKSIDRRLSALEDQTGRLLLAYTSGWAVRVDEHSPPGEARIDAPPAPLQGGEPDPRYVYVPDQRRAPGGLGWTRRAKLKADPTVAGVIIWGNTIEELT
jgi:hypothetical protein